MASFTLREKDVKVKLSKSDLEVISKQLLDTFIKSMLKREPIYENSHAYRFVKILIYNYIIPEFEKYMEFREKRVSK